MTFDDSGRSRSVALIALLLAVVAIVAGVGLALGAMDSGSDDRTGEEILSDVQDTYTDADSVSSDAVVTVEIENETTEFEVSAAAAGAEQMRVNVSDGEQYVLTGVDDGTLWRYDSVTEITGVIDSDGDTLTVSLRGGTEAPARPDLSGIPEGIGLDTDLSSVLESFDGELPDELDGLPANATIGELLANDTLAGDFEAVLGDSGGELPDNLGEFEFPANDSAFELPAEFEDGEFPANLSELEPPEDFEFPANLSELEPPEDFEFPANLSELEPPEDFEFPANLSELEPPEDFEFPANLSEFEPPEDFEFPANLSEFEPPEDWNKSELRQQINQSLVGGFNSSAVSVERVGTTTVDGTEANELLVTHPDSESETRLWTDAESDTVLKQETTAPGLTVTVDVQETRFDVAPADSTFEPPGAVQLASLSLSTADTLDTFESTTPFETPDLGEDWSFEQGAVLSGAAPPLTGITDLDASEFAAAVYTEGESTVVVGQSNLADDFEVEPVPGAETEIIGDREVLLFEGPNLSAGVFDADGTAVVVAGDLTGQELAAVVADLEL